MPSKIDLNADLGEHLVGGFDTELLGVVTSANICCGVHAGSRELTRRTIAIASDTGVSIGAHPGMPGSFGRSLEPISAPDAFDQVAVQLSEFLTAAKDYEAKVSHVKVHGALYNQAEANPEIADAIIRAIGSVTSSLVVVGLAGGRLIEEASANGLSFAGEFFADRSYRPDGRLTSRATANSVIEDETEIVQRCIVACKKGVVPAVDGSLLQIEFETICLHGDNRHALASATLLKQRLLDENIQLSPIVRSFS